MTGNDELQKENQTLQNEIEELKNKLQKVSDDLSKSQLGRHQNFTVHGNKNRLFTNHAKFSA